MSGCRVRKASISTHHCFRMAMFSVMFPAYPSPANMVNMLRLSEDGSDEFPESGYTMFSSIWNEVSGI